MYIVFYEQLILIVLASIIRYVYSGWSSIENWISNQHNMWHVYEIMRAIQLFVHISYIILCEHFVHLHLSMHVYFG